MGINDLRNQLKGFLNPKDATYNEYCNIIDKKLSLEDLNNSLDYMNELNQNGRIHEISKLSNKKQGYSIIAETGMDFIR